MEPTTKRALDKPDPGSPDYDYSEIDRKSEQAEAEMQEIIVQGLPSDDVTTVDDLKQRMARLHSSA